ncbi:uncharacterized protein MELLADRAFT_47234 [Melampsora larici-populina 98AG31]|uniref:Peroxisomal membrane protein PEX16 n=1 Tax=Melampsora larici-populina (strain 98AG31 / pathotype 3-4-7) TaxID=747676 RepID=F4RBS6_MELLP|nr:uncharacterized protein MELLADRAFT_47234 [Melampsora larici-populina 98AG31]EGG10285.1 hypothetical protein MELLADRAFT_47234 [Melampsora larici-populina 98AG31]
MSFYPDFLLANATRITSIESTLRTATWFLPGRFKDAELASEALFSALNIVSSYHDSVITKAAESLPAASRPPSSSHNRYTAAWSEKSNSYKTLAHTLSILENTQRLFEMWARRRLGSKGRWRIVLFIECLKAFLRLRLVRLTGRMIIAPSLPERTVDPAILDAHRPVLHGQPPNAQLVLPSPSQATSWTGSRTGFERPSIAIPPNVVNDFLARRALTPEEMCKPRELVHKLRSNRAQLAEFIWNLRPVIYVLAINRYGQRHVAPFLCSLSIEYLSYSLRQASLQEPNSHQFRPKTSNRPSFLSDLEKNELLNRQKAFWQYFLRGPLWALWTQPKLSRLAQRLSNKPLLNLVSTFLDDYIPLIDEYYYYSS